MQGNKQLKKRTLVISLASIMCGAGTLTAAHAGDITGTFMDPASGKPVASVRITAKGTGFNTLTDGSGQFSLRNVPQGQYTLIATLPSQNSSSTTVDVPDQGTVLASFGETPTTLTKITVAANRYDASNIQMNAENTVSVLSADDLQYTAVHNVAEALGLMSGVNVFNTGQSYFGGVDGAARGEGMFASVRGLNAEYNVNLINGINVAQGMPYSRSVQLSLLPPSGLQTIVLNKTSTADMDGDAIGGTIDFRTPTAFDFTAPTSGSITASGRVESRARDYGKNGLGGGLAGDFQTKFGDDKQFGVYASAYYDERNFVNSEVAAASAALNDGSWAFARSNASGDLAPGYDLQNNLMSTGMNIGYSSGSTKRYGGNVSLDWKVDPTLLLYARMTYAYAKTEQDTGYTQLVPANVSYSQIGNSGVYQPMINRVAVRYWYETNPEIADLATFQVGAEKKIGAWTLTPSLFYSYGDNDRPDHVEISARNDQYPTSNFAYGANSFVTYGSNGYPIPLLTPDMLNQVNSIGSLYARRSGQLTKQYSGQTKGGIKLDARYDNDDGALTNLQFGVKYVDSSRTFTSRDWTTAKYTDHRLFDSLGLIDGTYSSVYPGQYGWSTVQLSNSGLKNLIQQRLTASAFDTCGSLYVNNYNCDTMRGTEAVSAAYAKATFQVDGLEIIPGFRFEHTSIQNTYWVMPKDSQGNELPGYFSNNRTTYNVPLPSIFLNYRPQDSDAVYRGSIWESYTRPALVQLGGSSNYSVSDGVVSITEGNPNLKPIKSLNVDFSGEWQSEHGGHAMVSGFYKELSNYIYESGTNSVNPSESDLSSVKYIKPNNGGDGKVYGLEVSVRQKLQDMPAPLDGVGVGFNMTKQRTSVDLGMKGFENERIQNAPDTMANAELFYEKSGFSANLSWHYSGSYISTYDYLNQGTTADDLWIRPVTRVDLHLGYDFRNGLRLDLSVANLTNNESFWSHVGKNSRAISDIVDAGTTTLLTAKYAF
jgi:TonB-dependent receptor